MSEQQDQGMRYTPTTPEASQVVSLAAQYRDAYEAARRAADALLQWTAEYCRVTPGIIVEAGKKISIENPILVSNFDLTGTFTGWKTHRPRMIVESVSMMDNRPLTTHPCLQLKLTGIPIKEDGTPFLKAKCHATVDLSDMADIFSLNEKDRYASFHLDSLARLIDYVQAKREEAKQPSQA